MSRVLAHVVLEQARRAGAWFSASWIATTGVAIAAALVGGVDVAEVLTPSGVARVAALSFTAALAFAMPMAVVGHAVRLGERGETVAAATAGVPPWMLALALALPWGPWLAVLPRYADAVRPAALAATLDAAQRTARRDPLRFLSAASSAGVAVAASADGVRVLAVLPDGCVGLALAGAPRMDGRRLHAGPIAFDRVSVDGARVGGRVGRAELELRFGDRPLSRRSEREMSTAFLARQSGRFIRARATVPGQDAADRVARELRARASLLPSALLALLWAARSACAFRPRPAFAWVVYALPAAALSAILPRVVAGW